LGGEGIKIQTMNLSKYSLNQVEVDILERGLSFIPTPKTLPISTLIKDKNRLIRSIHLKYFFQTKKDDKKIKRFVEKSTWEPPLKLLPPECLATTKKLNKNFNEFVKKQERLPNSNVIRLREPENMSKTETTALKNLSKLNNIIIKPADKGGATVIMDLENYLLEAQRQLSDRNYYQQLTGPTYLNNIIKIHEILESLQSGGYISAKQLDYLSGPKECDPRTFYLLPKIHKPPETWTVPHKMPQGRPIVSDVNSESYRVSEYIDYFLNPLASRHKAFIKNTYDFVERVRDQPTDTMDWLVTGDVTSLYTNMNIDRTIRIVKETLSKAPLDPERPDKEILELLELTMRNNDFQFNGQFFLQICGTAMGKMYAPSLANLYLLEFDEKAQYNFEIKPQNYGRYLDDIFFTWKGTETDLQRFEDFLNSLIPGIKIKFEKRQKEKLSRHHNL
jgi:hypothetical protein